MYNVLMITPDQLRADYLSCYGHKTINTKNIDRLAADGVRFENCYCAAPLCGPSRISFATSTYVGEHNHRNYGCTISPDVPNLISSLKKHGYKTGMFGKNHLFTPNRLSEVWDELDEICLGNYDEHPDYIHSYSAFTLDKDHPYNITKRLTDEAIDFIGRASEPFVVWLNYQDPHPAFTCPPPYDTMFDYRDLVLPESYYAFMDPTRPARNLTWRTHSEMELASSEDIQKAIAMYMGKIRYVDDCVGALLDFLKSSGRYGNTLVLFFSDHGELIGDYGMTHKLPAFYDCLTKIPVIIRHPGKDFAGKVFGGLTEEVDLAPTLLSMLGIKTPDSMVGISLLTQIENNTMTGKENVICEAGGGAPTCKTPIAGLKLRAPGPPTSYGPGAMIREGNYKLSIYNDDNCELYDLTNDPHEMRNLYNDPKYSDTVAALTLKLLKRILGVKVRRAGAWNKEECPVDYRFHPLE